MESSPKPVVVVALGAREVHRGIDGGVSCGTIAELLSVLSRSRDADAVLVSDGLSAADAALVAQAVRARTGQTIEVRSERWDGETPSPLSAACRGVISGFGAAGVARAVELLEAER